MCLSAQVYIYIQAVYSVWENHTWTFKMAFEGLWVGERRGGWAKPSNNGGDRSATAHLAKTAMFTLFNSVGNNTNGVFNRDRLVHSHS